MGSILKLLRFVGRIWLNGSGIRLVITLSLEEVKSSLIVLNWSRISSLVYSVWSSLCIVLYKDHVTVICLSLLTHIFWSCKRVYRLRIIVGLQALKIAFVKSAKSS